MADACPASDPAPSRNGPSSMALISAVLPAAPVGPTPSRSMDGAARTAADTWMVCANPADGAAGTAPPGSVNSARPAA